MSRKKSRKKKKSNRNQRFLGVLRKQSFLEHQNPKGILIVPTKPKKKKKINPFSVVIIILIVVIGYYFLFQTESSQESGQEPTSQAITSFISDSPETLTIMNWNIQTFGKAKWNKTDVRNRILSIVPMADITFIQEIRDISGETFIDLCNQLNQTHKCNISSRAGRTSSKEQYGIVYKKDIEIIDLIDFNPNPLDNWERPPIEVTFSKDGYEFRAVNIHIKPDDVANELKQLEGIYYLSSWNGNRIWLGDFNADGTYYDDENNVYLLTEVWVIQNTDDTTVAESSNAYDRIILNHDMNKEVIRYGIYTNITKDVSDHYPVWVEVKAEETI